MRTMALTGLLAPNWKRPPPQNRNGSAGGKGDEFAAPHVSMAPALQEITTGAAPLALAVIL